MTGPRHVVLGGNGVVGRETVSALLDRGEKTVAVGRRSCEIDGAICVTADLLDRSETARALRGAGVAYFTVGLPYSARVWADQWPLILRNTVEAALENGTHLVYFDNVYAYGHVLRPMTEKTKIRPTTKKGRVRAEALELLADATARGLTVTIGRSADFYGPGASTSAFNTLALNKIAAGKTGTWLYDADQPHSMTYTPDIGQGLATLGQAEKAKGGVWHLPTAPPLTGREYMRLAAGPVTATKVMGAAMMRFGALFNGVARETLEMSYQYTSPYVFDSSAFESTFGVVPTSVEQGIAETLAAARSAMRG